jgi:PPM family protein phosphatase
VDVTGLVAGAASHPGRVRSNNEDSYLCDADGQRFAVADGMGGHAAGEIASRMAIDVVRQAWSDPTMAPRLEAFAGRGEAADRRALFQAVRQGVLDAHLQIVEASQADDDKRGMGTTFTGFLVAGGDAVFAHAGDTRAYLVRDDIAIQLSEDHTVLARLRAAGIERGDGDPNRWAGVLTNALGIGDGTRVAIFVVPLYPADRLVLCSDGVTEYIAENELPRLLDQAGSPQRGANLLVERAVASGGADNATAVVVRVLEVGETRVPPDQRDRDADAVARSPLLEGLGPQERLRALRIATPREAAAGREVPAAALGDRVAHIVLSGAVEHGGRALGPGDPVYPAGLVSGTPLPTRLARATADTRLLTIRRDDFLELSEDEPELGVKLYAALARLMAG